MRKNCQLFFFFNFLLDFNFENQFKSKLEGKKALKETNVNMRRAQTAKTGKQKVFMFKIQRDKFLILRG